MLLLHCRHSSRRGQTHSWKVTHKNNCVPHPTVAALNGAKPEKFSHEWLELEVDKALSKWINEWRTCFMHWTRIALDLSNNPPNRTVTHCVHLVVEPRHFEDKPYRNYRVIHAEVIPLTQVQERYPELVVHVDPTDLTRLRYVVTLQNEKGEIRRVRLLQWDDLGLASWKTIPAHSSAELAEGFAQTLIYSVEYLALGDVQQKLGLKR